MSLEEEDFHCSYLRCNFSIMFLLEGLVIAMFALFATYNDQSESSDIESILLNGLAILGFGLLLIEHEKNIKQVFVFIFLAFSLNIQLFPLFG